MASKTFARFATRATPFASAARRAASRVVRSSYRGYSSEAGGSSKSNAGLYAVLGFGAVGGAGYYAYSNGLLDGQPATPKVFSPGQKDYQAVYNAIAERLIEEDEYDDGSYGPVLLRLAWHASGTYDKETGTGGSNGATMRFAPEGDHGANAGLKAARDFLEPVRAQHPWISYSDLWTLAGVCAVQEMQGPAVPWRPGRADRDLSFCTPDGRLPDGAKGGSHLRAIFGRMGWDDREIVALSGAHALGRCHTDRSGFDGPWTFSPTTLTNDYYKLLLEEKWTGRRWNGPKQFQDVGSKSLMMLPTDMALIQDKAFRPHVERYARDNDAFFRDFSDVIMRLFELGVPFASKVEDRMTLKTLEQQEK